MSLESEWSEGQRAEYLGTSSDLDDQSLSARLRIVEYLKAKGELSLREEHWLTLLGAMNKAELEFLNQTPSYRVRNGWPRWQWPSELEELLRQ